MKASEFKARCHAVLEEVRETGREIMITKRGKPVAKLVPVEPPPSLRGSITYLVTDEELIKPVPVRWHAEEE